MKRIIKLIVATAVGLTGIAVVAPAAHAAVVGSQFTAVTPCRVFDTRLAIPESACSGVAAAAVGRIGATVTRPVKIAGIAGVPANATAVVLNLTASDATAPTYVTAFNGNTLSPTSNLNVVPGAVVANQVTVPLSGGFIGVYNNAGATDVLADLSGYFTPDAAAGYTALTPCRAFDTRTQNITSPCSSAPSVVVAKIPAGGSRTVQLAGVGGISASATSVTMNLTAVSATAPTFVTAYPADRARPVVSSLNLISPNPVPNLITVRLSGDGKVTFYNNAGSIDLLADVSGYYANGSGASFATVPTLCRIFDTRLINGTCTNQSLPDRVKQPIRSGNTGRILLQVGNIGGVPPNADIATVATAAVFNVTVVNATAPTFVSIYPGLVNASVPTFSNLNLATATAVPNAAVVRLPPLGTGANTGCIWIYNNVGTADVVLDLVGYYFIPPAG